MKKYLKRLSVVTLLCSLLLPATVFAAFVDGGEWHYGVGWTGTYGYSNYYHGSRSHTATVKNGPVSNSQRQGAGAWAQTSITKIPPTGMEYYYGF